MFSRSVKNNHVFHLAGWQYNARTTRGIKAPSCHRGRSCCFAIVWQPTAATVVDYVSLIEQLLDNKIVADCFSRFIYYMLKYTRPASHPYGVLKKKPATNSMRPTLLNSAVGRSRHRHTYIRLSRWTRITNKSRKQIDIIYLVPVEIPEKKKIYTIYLVYNMYINICRYMLRLGEERACFKISVKPRRYDIHLL